jgi:protein TonB
MLAVAAPVPFARLRLVSLASVVGVHLAALWGLAAWSMQPQPSVEPRVLSVSFLTAEPVKPPEPLPPAPPPPKPVVQPKPKPLITAKPEPLPDPIVAPTPPPPAEAEPAEAIAAYAPPSAPAEKGEPMPAPPRFDIDYLNNPSPAYPAMSRKLGEEGTVLLRVLVSATGDALNVELDRSSGHARLDDAARRAVRKWRFVPARRGEQAVDGWALVPITFSRKR